MEATTPELGPVGFWSPKSSSFSGSDSIVVEKDRSSLQYFITQGMGQSSMFLTFRTIM